MASEMTPMEMNRAAFRAAAGVEMGAEAEWLIDEWERKYPLRKTVNGTQGGRISIYGGPTGLIARATRTMHGRTYGHEVPVELQCAQSRSGRVKSLVSAILQAMEGVCRFRPGSAANPRTK